MIAYALGTACIATVSGRELSRFHHQFGGDARHSKLRHISAGLEPLRIGTAGHALTGKVEST